MQETLSEYRRFIVTGILVFFSLGFLIFFPESDRVSPVFQGAVIGLIFFLVIPLLYSRLILKEPLKNLGLQRGHTAAGIFSGIFSVVLALAIVVALAYAFPAFREQYNLPVLVERSFFWFVFYELVLASAIALLYEIFFRGMVELLWLKETGIWAVFLQAALFLGFIYLSDTLSWQKVPLLLFSPFAGFIAYRSQSLWYSFIASWLFFFLTDIFFLIFH